MNLSEISKDQLVQLVTQERLDRRLFEMILSRKSYDEIGQLYSRLRNDGILQIEEGRWRLCDEAILFAQPLVEEVETIMAELTSFLQSLLDEQALEGELEVSKMGVFWWGACANCYRFNVLENDGEFIIKGRFSSELKANDGAALPFHVFSLKPPLEPQVDYLKDTILAHIRWAKKMKMIGRGLTG